MEIVEVVDNKATVKAKWSRDGVPLADPAGGTQTLRVGDAISVDIPIEFNIDPPQPQDKSAESLWWPESISGRVSNKEPEDWPGKRAIGRDYGSERGDDGGESPEWKKFARRMNEKVDRELVEAYKSARKKFYGIDPAKPGGDKQIIFPISKLTTMQDDQPVVTPPLLYMPEGGYELTSWPGRWIPAKEHIEAIYQGQGESGPLVYHFPRSASIRLTQLIWADGTEWEANS